MSPKGNAQRIFVWRRLSIEYNFTMKTITMLKNDASISQIRADNQWAEGLDDSAFIFQCRKRGLEPSNAMDLYSFISMIEDKMIAALFFAHIKNMSFPSSMMAWLLKEKEWLDNPQAIDVFIDLKPTAMDYCWVFTHRPELRYNQKMFCGFLETNPTDSYIDYLVRVVKFNVSWFEDKEEVERVLNFVQSAKR